MPEQSDSELRKIYAQFAPPLLAMMERQKKAFQHRWLILEIIFTLLAAVLAVANREEDFFETIIIGWGIVSVFLPFFLRVGIASERNVFYKKTVIPELLKIFDKSIEFQPSGCVPVGTARACGLIRGKIDRYSGQDLVRGNFQGVPFAFSEIHAQERHTSRDSKGHTRTYYTTLFRGILMHSDFHKNFAHQHYILPDTAERIFGRLAGSFLQSCNCVGNGKITRLEDPEFEKMYAVYSQDPVEARYLLTPKLMRTLIRFRQVFGHGTCVSFIGSEIFLALPLTANYFEYAGGTPDFEKFRKTYKEFESIFSVLDSLDLDLRIWSKE